MRLIDADTLKKKLFVFDMEFHDGHHQKYYVYKEKDVDDAPTIEPPTTTWLGSYSPYTCEKCGFHVDSKTRYCPDCGRRASNYEV